jgi:hypothetical protein
MTDVAGGDKPFGNVPGRCRGELSLVGQTRWAARATCRSKFIIRAAIAEAGALLGIVGFMTTGQWWMVPIVLVIAVVGFASTAPTAAAVEREQQVLIAQGSPLPLTAAMLNAPVAWR